MATRYEFSDISVSRQESAIARRGSGVELELEAGREKERE